MSEPRINEAQAAILYVLSTRGGATMSVIGSDNDILWGELSDRGWMEAADLPKGISLPGESLNSWALTKAGKAAIGALAVSLNSPTPPDLMDGGPVL